MKKEAAHSRYPRTIALGDSKADFIDQMFAIATILVIVAGVVIKFVGVDHQSLWHDELATFVFTQRDVSAGQLYRQFWDDDGHPPLYYALTHYWTMMFPITNEITLRSFSAVLAAASSLAALFAFRQLLSMPGRLLLTVLISCNFGSLYYGQELHTKGWSDRLPHRVYLQTDLIPSVYLGPAFKPAVARRDWEWPVKAWQGGEDLKRIVHSVIRENARTQNECPVLLWMVNFPAMVLDELEWPPGVEVRKFFEAAVVVGRQPGRH